MAGLAASSLPNAVPAHTTSRHAARASTRAGSRRFRCQPRERSGPAEPPADNRRATSSQTTGCVMWTLPWAKTRFRIGRTRVRCGLDCKARGQRPAAGRHRAAICRGSPRIQDEHLLSPPAGIANSRGVGSPLLHQAVDGTHLHYRTVLCASRLGKQRRRAERMCCIDDWSAHFFGILPRTLLARHLGKYPAIRTGPSESGVPR